MKSHKKTPTPDLDALMPILFGVWRRFHKLSGPPDQLQTREFRSVVAAVKALQAGFSDGQSLVGKDYFANPEWLGAYLLYQWVVHYQQGLSLIGELPTTPHRVLDVCSGPGAFAFAALRHGAQDVIATDQNMKALQLGAEVCGRNGYPLSIRQWKCPKERLPIEGEFDLIILGHCLEELFPSTNKKFSQDQDAFVNYLLNRLTPCGYLMIVDSSFQETNQRILQLRDTQVKGGVPVQAPCVWKGECPALHAKNSPCYAQREFEKPYLIKEIQRAAEINLSSLKMSYIIFKHPLSGWPELPERDLYRVISPPIDSFGGKKFYLCGNRGKMQLSTHLKEHPAESRAFEYLRRGELISLDKALEKSHSLEIIEGTVVKVEAACGKPLCGG